MRIVAGLVTSLVVLSSTSLGLTKPAPPSLVTDVDTVPLHAVTRPKTLPAPAVDAHRSGGPHKPLLMPNGDAVRLFKELMRSGRIHPRPHGRIAIDTPPPPGIPGPLPGTVVGQFEGPG